MGNCDIRDKPRPLAAMFFNRSNIVAIFVEGYLVTFSSESFSILTISFREEDI